MPSFWEKFRFCGGCLARSPNKMNNGSRDPHVGREEKPVAEQHPLMDNGDGVVLFQPEGDTAILTTSSLVSWPSSPRQPRSDPGTAGVLGGRISRDAESVVEVERRALLGGAVAGSSSSSYNNSAAADNGAAPLLFQPSETSVTTNANLSAPSTAWYNMWTGGRSSTSSAATRVPAKALFPPPAPVVPRDESSDCVSASGNHGHGSSATKFDYSFFALQAPRIFGFLLALVLLVFVVYMYKDKLETGGEHLLDTTQYYVHRAMETLK
mmetsp:Transcript_22825/g.57723  ORF Transcript_22825/g.57723 Transcript_22825/m.57723 type:complete len:267 (+) Transcript_22825:81-881(+)